MDAGADTYYQSLDAPRTQVTGLDPESIRKTQGTRFGSVSLVFPDALCLTASFSAIFRSAHPEWRQTKRKKIDRPEGEVN